ncbi:MAG: permease [Acetobacteraceae bacterium]|nr:permease [Acetobacteraceae bacterium]
MEEVAAVALVFKVLAGGGRELLEYLSAHVLTCLVPAFFIAGAIAVFVSGPSVLKYFGPRTNRFLSYGVASVSGVILAVCSCTVLPLFAGIYRKGAGLGPAVAFLYSGPAINLLAIVLTARKLGWELGLARALGAVAFSIGIGAIMALAYRREERRRRADGLAEVAVKPRRSGLQLLVFFGILVAILLWGTARVGLWPKLGGLAALAAGLAAVCWRWFDAEELKDWGRETLRLVRLIFPVLLAGVFVAGMLKQVLPPEWVSRLVGGNSALANLGASLFGALMYFSTLTEVPILRMLLDLGMGKGPALALLLSGPAVSLPSLLAIRNIMGTQKTLLYVVLVAALSAAVGMLFGGLVGQG